LEVTVRRKSKAATFLEGLVGPLTLGGLIEAIRTSEEITLQAYAAKLGVSRAHLCDIEKGRRTLSAERAAKWARLLEQPESLFVQLALQAAIDAAGLKYRVNVEAA
jgi:antitoxin HigA-1